MKNIYARWLRKEGLTIRDFSDATGIDYNTAYRWFTEAAPNAKPRRIATKAIMRVFPNWPI